MTDKKVPEAALFAASYCPSQLPPLIEKWNKEVHDKNKNQYKSNAFDHCSNKSVESNGKDR